MQRTGSALWNGSLRDGKGALNTESGLLDNSPYSFAARFENGKGTNPEELLAAAHAGCFTMDLSSRLGKAGMVPDSVQTTATVTIEQVANGFEIPAISLKVIAKVPSANKEKFLEEVENARVGCPVSKLFKANISVEAQLA